jgi:hypothetical protein
MVLDVKGSCAGRMKCRVSESGVIYGYLNPAPAAFFYREVSVILRPAYFCAFAFFYIAALADAVRELWADTYITSRRCFARYSLDPSFELTVWTIMYRDTAPWRIRRKGFLCTELM